MSGHGRPVAVFGGVLDHRGVKSCSNPRSVLYSSQHFLVYKRYKRNREHGDKDLDTWRVQITILR